MRREKICTTMPTHVPIRTVSFLFPTLPEKQLENLTKHCLKLSKVLEIYSNMEILILLKYHGVILKNRSFKVEIFVIRA